MSVRRLADLSEQPQGFAFSAENSEWAQRTIRKYPEGREQSAVIPLLMRAQEQDGWVTKAAIEHVAAMLGMPLIRVLEVATFYTQFQLKPVGTRAHVQVCGTTPCMLRGSEQLMDVCRKKIHPEPHHPNADGTLSWEEVECQGACVNAPMVIIFKDAYEDLTPERLEEIIDAFESGDGAGVPTGPQNGRTFSAPKTGLTSLTDEKTVLKSTRSGKAGAGKGNAEGTKVAPSNAAKPKTDAPETSVGLKTPSAKKTSPKAEKATSVAPPAYDKTAANATEPSVEGVTKQRTSRASAEKPSLDDPRRPAGMEKPAAGDDLKMISGVGPKLEGLLHSLGIYTFAQISEWNEEQRAWMDSYLNFKGRIDRDEWVRQAKVLNEGGVDEYIRVFGKKPV